MDGSRHHQLQEQEQQVDLEVVGRHALLFDDDSTSAFINSSDVLVPWSGGDASLLIDRFDARHLLPQLPLRGAWKRQLQEDNLLEPDGVSRIELDAERYRDLENGGDGEDQQDGVKKNGAKSGIYRTVPFSYNASGDLKSQEDGLEHSCYRPPFPVPEYLLSNLPLTEKVHQIISRTAKFVNEHGGQTEIILRVKQGGNPSFGFLMPDHKLHAYFRFLVDHPELSRSVTDTVGKLEEKKTLDSVENALYIAGGALSLLGSVYGTGEDDGIPDTSETRETLVKSSKDAASATAPRKSQTSTSRFDDETKAAIKLPPAVSEKPLLSKRSRSSAMIDSAAARSRTKEVTAGSPDSFISKSGADSSRPRAPVVEPPSNLKRMVEKTVEFICRNGKEFEASLIQQDKMNEKFPFLRSSNQYHSYYLKVLQHARETKLPYKNISDHRVGSKAEAKVADDYPSDAWNVEKQFEAPLQLDRKEKFRMVLGGSKKDANNSSSKPSKPPGLSAEEAAAIVLGATRGRLGSQTMPDAPKMPAIHVPDAIRRAVEGPSTSSLASFPPFPASNPPSKSTSDSEGAADLPNGSSPAKESDSTAGCIAKEADSSVASATEEQKLKAERLKRAKLFAAMIKSGKHKADEHAAAPSPIHSGHEPQPGGGSGREEGNSSLVVPAEAENSGSGEKPIQKLAAHGGVQHAEDPEAVEREHSRKRHRSRQHSNGDGHKREHRRHRHHRSPPSEDDGRQRRKHRHHRSSSSKRKRRGSDEDEDEDGRSHKNKRSSGSQRDGRDRRRHREEEMGSDSRRDLPSQGDSSSRPSSEAHHPRGPSSKDPPSDGVQEEARPSVATEVPDDLRAKIRAMLLETL
ncbi:unnamed protein product [Spirodela intermedia]|uniref:SURP motif domain-containing protein n=1 Tax=Spirodela intermedia TaxID=51605 RepID=A0A7I8LFC7_SPIIN|nr:unnamed protein product [Spirodela intermedia]